MIRRFDHVRLSPDELREQMHEHDLTVGRLSRITGIMPDTIKRWLLPIDHERSQEPPFIITQFLALYRLPGGADTAWDTARAAMIEAENGRKQD